MRFIFNTALCQSPANISKTKKAMNFIKQAMFYRCTQIDTSKNGIHHITIIYTNNNLARIPLFYEHFPIFSIFPNRILFLRV